MITLVYLMKTVYVDSLQKRWAQEAFGEPQNHFMVDYLHIYL